MSRSDIQRYPLPARAAVSARSSFPPTSGVRLAPADALDVAAIVETIFDAAEHRVLYEVPSAPALIRGATGRYLCPSGTGVVAALAFATARERLKQPQFVVLVCDDPQWPSAIGRQLPVVRQVRERFVLIVPGTREAISGQSSPPPWEALESAGWRICEAEGRDLARTLVEARVSRSPSVVLLADRRPASPARTSDLAGGRGTTRLRVEGSESSGRGSLLLADAIARRFATNLRHVVVALAAHPRWKVPDGEAQLTVAPSIEEIGPWCTALQEAGCQVLVVLDEAQYLLHRGSLWTEVCQGGARLVVLTSGDPFPPPISLPQVEHRVLPTEVSAAEVEQIVSRCVEAESPLVMFVADMPHVPNAPAEQAADEPGEQPPVGVSAAPLRSIPFAVSVHSAKSDQQEIERKRLRPEVLRWVAEYDRVGHRSVYLWRWCLHGIELTTFADVAESLRPHLHDTKLLSVILCVLFDDVADRHGRAELLETLIQSTLHRATATEPLSADEQCYVDVTQRLWAEYESRVRSYPEFGVYERLWRFDLLQFLNTMRYAHLVNSQPGLLNSTEHDVYTPHNMLMVSFSTLDLMCIPHFNTAELGNLREAMWHAQAMGRIGNVLSTWRRELEEADFSGGIFAGDQATPEAVREQKLLEKWRWHRERCHQAAQRVHSIDLAPVLGGHDRFLDMHLASAGRI